MKFYGNNLVQLQSTRSWDPRGGWFIRIPYRGSPFAVAAKIAELRALNIRFDHDAPPEGGFQTVTALIGAEETQSPNEPLSDKWSMPGNDLEKDIFLHPRVIANFVLLMDSDGFPTDGMIRIRSDIDKLLSGELTLANVTWWPTASIVTKKLLRALLRGETSYRLTQRVVRNTKIVAANYTNALALDSKRVNKVMTVEQFISLYRPTPIIEASLRTLPGGSPSFPGSSVSPNGFMMEDTPTLEQVSYDKYQIDREWRWFQEYDDLLYDLVTE